MENKERIKPFLVDGIKCQCGKPSYIHITSLMPNGQVNFACDRYIYTRGNDGCSGFIHEGQMFWKDEEPLDGSDRAWTGAYTR